MMGVLSIILYVIPSGPGLLSFVVFNIVINSVLVIFLLYSRSSPPSSSDCFSSSCLLYLMKAAVWFLCPTVEKILCHYISNLQWLHFNISVIIINYWYCVSSLFSPQLYRLQLQNSQFSSRSRDKPSNIKAQICYPSFSGIPAHFRRTLCMSTFQSIIQALCEYSFSRFRYFNKYLALPRLRYLAPRLEISSDLL